MRSAVFIVFIFFIVQNLYAHDNVIIFENEKKGSVKILEILKKKYFVSANSISLLNKDRLDSKITFHFECNDAVVHDDFMLLATNAGIKVFNPGNNSLSGVEYVSQTNISHVIVDKLNRIWYTSPYEGCFMIADSSRIITKVQAPFISSLACTPDSNVWVGTNVGLYQIPPFGNEIFRYHEEGISGFEIPDAIIKNIYADDASNVWVIMPDNISFIAGKNFDGEIPNYSYVGKKGNTIFDICKLPLSPRSYFLATSQGLLYTADLKGGESHHSGEIHQAFEEEAFMIDDKIIKKPSELKNYPVVSIQAINNEIFFITQKGLWSISTKKLLHDLKNI